MKWRCVLLLCVMVIAYPLHSQTLSPAIAFEEREYDFGTIPEENGKVAHTFIFHNKGNTPVVIDEIYSGCGCIGKTVSKAPVKPGGKGEIVITFNPDYKSGFFSKEIVVFSNAGKNYNRIWVKGVVKEMEHPIEDDYPYNFGEGLYLRLRVMAFGYLKPGESRQMELHYANNTDKPMTFDLVVQGSKEGLAFTNPGKIGPKARGVVKFYYTMPYLGASDAKFYVHPYVNNVKLPDMLEIKILSEDKLNQRDVSALKN